MFWIKLLANFLKILREGQTPRQVAAGFALGSIVGLSPVLTLQGILLWLIILMFDVNLSAALVAFTVFSLIAFLADPLFHWLGYLLLVDVEGLRGIWTTLYNMPVVPLTRFYNTVVLGSFLCGVVLSVLVYIGMFRFVVLYRSTVGVRIERWKIYQVLSRTSLIKLYQRIRNFAR